MSSDDLRRYLTERFLGFDFFSGVYFQGSGGDGCNNSCSSSCWVTSGRDEVELAGHSLGSLRFNPQVLVDGDLGTPAATLLPPSDIGNGDIWTKDSSVLYNGIASVYKDYSRAVCPGRYTVRANHDWYNNNHTTNFGDNEIN
uniref:Uncharacterized protein n=1 Tax=Chromera velia CCMP2878 TaxID=1169474 RepID=A0A0G4H3Z9_9ALVE|eukprot:Cvel_5671.t1-p1 / transcript=Cvel_5671.t1 / gene=Cvel_5671 / organism=Chromera_velia_CCMP2878 / gene_product=hypothetical protein / transcript_product=hypothetical protein / location=Cvel_scaffold267:100024-105748(+) / protein_length=141 / sequence_SO=supercontig / SO=protein_coding / is_pseudo=false